MYKLFIVTFLISNFYQSNINLYKINNNYLEISKIQYLLIGKLIIFINNIVFHL